MESGRGKKRGGLTSLDPPADPPASLPTHPVRQSVESPVSSDNVSQKGSSPPQLEIRRALDLFSGTGSVKKYLQEVGFEVLSLDIDPKCKPDLCKDLMQWRYWTEFRPGHFELICASVPCSQYSRANTTGVRDHVWADALANES